MPRSSLGRRGPEPFSLKELFQSGSDRRGLGRLRVFRCYVPLKSRKQFFLCMECPPWLGVAIYALGSLASRVRATARLLFVAAHAVNYTNKQRANNVLHRHNCTPHLAELQHGQRFTTFWAIRCWHTWVTSVSFLQTSNATPDRRPEMLATLGCLICVGIVALACVAVQKIANLADRIFP